jgi:hypothetical protein
MADDRLLCPNCDKAYRWKTKIAGRRVRCACGQTFRVPMQPGGQAVAEGTPNHPPPARVKKPPPPAAETNPYELDLPDDKPAAEPRRPTAAKNHGKCPSCNQAIRPGAVICLNCVFNLAEGSRVQTVVAAGAAAVSEDDDAGADDEDPRVQRSREVSDYDRQVESDTFRQYRFQDSLLPLIFAAIGLGVTLVNAFVLAPQATAAADWFGFGTASRTEIAVSHLIGAGILLCLQVPCLLAGLVVVAQLFGSAFGELFSVLRRLVGLALFTGSLYHSIDLGVNILMGGLGGLGWMFTLSISFAIFWGAIVALFEELEFNEVGGLFVAMIIAPGALLWLAEWLLAVV